MGLVIALLGVLIVSTSISVRYNKKKLICDKIVLEYLTLYIISFSLEIYHSLLLYGFLCMVYNFHLLVLVI